MPTRDEHMQLGARQRRAHEFGLARRVDAVHGKDTLGEIDPNEQNRHGLPLPDELMSKRTSHRGTRCHWPLRG